MPQLDFSTFAPQLIWLVISFVALYLLMARVALPRIATVLEERRDRVANDLDEAEKLKRDTETAIANYETALAEARARAHDIATATREKLSAEIDVERQRVEDDLNTKAAAAEETIRAAKDEALAEIGNIANETAESIVKELVGGRWTKAKISAAVTAAMKD